MNILLTSRTSCKRWRQKPTWRIAIWRETQNCRFPRPRKNVAKQKSSCWKRLRWSLLIRNESNDWLSNCRSRYFSRQRRCERETSLIIVLSLQQPWHLRLKTKVGWRLPFLQAEILMGNSPRLLTFVRTLKLVVLSSLDHFILILWSHLPFLLVIAGRGQNKVLSNCRFLLLLFLPNQYFSSRH